MNYLGVKRIDEEDGRYYVTPLCEVRLVFLGSAVHSDLVTTTGYVPALFRPNRVYIRTNSGLYLTRFRSMEACESALTQANFAWARQSLLFNLRYMAWIEIRGQERLVKLLSSANNEGERFTITRACARNVLARLGVPVRASTQEG